MYLALAVSACLLSFGTPGQAKDPSSCNEAVDAYNNTVNGIADHLKRYSRCVGGSEGRDDCSTEFRRLRNSQSSFESAVSNFQSECD